MTDVLTNGKEIWLFIVNNGGLQPKKHDEFIKKELCARLGLPMNETKFLEGLMNVTPERFLQIFFGSVQPFSIMMTDLLVQFEKAGAKRSQTNITMEFDFDSLEEPFKFNVEQFLEWRSVWKRITKTQRTYQIGSQALWSILDDLSQKTKNPLNGQLHDEAIALWIAEYDRGQWPNEAPTFPGTHIDKLDACLGTFWQVWLDIVDELKSYGKKRLTFSEVEKHEAHKDTNLYELTLLDSDFWPREMLKIFATILDIVQHETKKGLISEITSLIETHLARWPYIDRTVDSLFEDLEALLTLPIWKKRHELYSAWVSTQIILAFDDETAMFIPENEVISFPFYRIHLATSKKYVPQLQLWSEVRSPLRSPRGSSRKRGIQPDYVLLTEIDDVSRSTILAVECKQYKNASKKNFSDALSDYANGLENAYVVLVNYGSANQRILQSVDPKVVSRVRLIGDFHPLSTTALNEFRNYIQQVLKKSRVLDGRVCLDFPSDQFKIAVRWSDGSSDLDVFLDYGGPNQGFTKVDWGNQSSDRTKLGHRVWFGQYPNYPLTGWAGWLTSDKHVMEVWVPDEKISLCILMFGDHCMILRRPIEGVGDRWRLFELDAIIKKMIVYDSIAQITLK